MFYKIFEAFLAILAVWFLLMMIIKVTGFLIHWTVIIVVAVGVVWFVKKLFSSKSEKSA